LEHAVVFHKDVLDVNSNVVVRIRIQTSLGVASFIDCEAGCLSSGPYQSAAWEETSTKKFEW
jgi:hypothetical protein